jgi:NADH:ubiquinone oxidoreductase subunit E
MVCTTCTACPNYLEWLLAQLRADYGSMIQIEPSECLAACDAAPAVFLNDTYYPRIDLGNLSALIDAELNAL